MFSLSLLSPEVSCLTVGLVSDNAGMGRPLLYLGLLRIAIGTKTVLARSFPCETRPAPPPRLKLCRRCTWKCGWFRINYLFGFLPAADSASKSGLVGVAG